MTEELSVKDLILMSSPSGFATTKLGRDLYPWQARVMESMAGTDLPLYSALVTANESGKTSEVITNLILWHMTVFPGSQTMTTSGNNRQIKYQLYPNLRMRLQRLKDWKIRDGNEYSLLAPNGSSCVSFSTDDVGMAEGFHKMALFNDGYTLGDALKGVHYDPVKNKSLLIIVDEAKTVNDEIFMAFERCHATRFLIASTPNHAAPMGYFYDCFHKDKWRYNTFEVTYKDCPHLNEEPMRKKERADQFRKWGINHPFIRSMYYGEFPTSGDKMVFDMQKMDAAMGGHIKPHSRDQRWAAIDLSGGGNECPMYVREGNEAKFAGSWFEADAVKLADELIKTFKKYQLRPEYIVADNGGIGDPIIDILMHKGWPIGRIDFGSTPSNGNQYANKRAEMYFELSHRINNGEIILPDDPDLKEQLGWQQYIENDKGQLRLKAKDKLPGSPDRADTVVMLFDDMPPTREQKSTNSLYGDDRPFTLTDANVNDGSYEGMFVNEGPWMLF